MKKDMGMEKAQDGRRARLQQKIETQITRVEGILEDLLAGVEMSELSSKDRLVAVAHFIALYQHTISIYNALEEMQAEKRESHAISAILRNMKTKQDRENSGEL